MHVGPIILFLRLFLNFTLDIFFVYNIFTLYLIHPFIYSDFSHYVIHLLYTVSYVPFFTLLAYTEEAKLVGIELIKKEKGIQNNNIIGNAFNFGTTN